MKSRIIVIAIFILVVLGSAGWILYRNQQKREIAAISNFEECTAAKYPILESYPRQCKTPDGRTFIEDVGNEMEKLDLIRISYPRPNQVITSPLVITGEARGYWFFEASFPVKLLDGEGNVIASHYAEAKDDWMTQDFVPFQATLEFQKPATRKGTLVLEKDNPSGLPEHADELRIPVLFRLSPF